MLQLRSVEMASWIVTMVEGTMIQRVRATQLNCVVVRPIVASMDDAVLHKTQMHLT